MSESSADREAMRLECQARVLKEIEEHGPDGVNRSALVEHYVSRGVPRVTAYRWIRHTFESGRARRHAAQMVERATPDAAVAAMPRPPSPDDVLAAATSGTIPFMAHLRQVLSASSEMEAAARGPDGRVRNLNGLSKAGILKLRALDVGLKAQQVLAELAEVDKFHAMVLEEISKESPEVTARIVQRLNALTAAWADG